MSLFTSVVNSLTGSEKRDTRNGYNIGRIERLCRALDWSIDEQEGKSIKLHFKDPVLGVRKLYLHGGDDPRVLMMVFSGATLPGGDVPDQVLSYLLRRNDEIPWGAWNVVVTDEGEAMFTLKYQALGAGLTPGVFKYICDTLIPEAGAFDEKMREAGFLT